MASNLLLAILVIPLMLVVVLATVSGFSNSTQTAFLGTATTNALVGNSTDATTVLAPPYNILDDNTATCKVRLEGTTLTALSSPTGTCTVTENAGFDSTITTVTNASDPAIIRTYLNYTPYSKDGYSQFSKVTKQTYNGFNLGALLPYILIAMAVVGIIVGLLAV